MKISNINSSISFCKKFLCNTEVVKNNIPYSCKIYEIEKGVDDDYFEKLLEDGKDWEEIEFLRAVNSSIKGEHKISDIYVLEDSKDKCLAFCEVDKNKKDNYYNIHLIQTAKSYSGYAKNKPIKYIAESLLAFIAKQAKREKVEKIYVASPLASSYGFYSKCGYRNVFGNNYVDFDKLPKEILLNEMVGACYVPVVLDKEKFDYLIEKNKRHILDCNI